MHCAACEVLIEKKILKQKKVRQVDASTNKGMVTMRHEGKSPSAEKLNHMFQEDNYQFSKEQPLEKSDTPFVMFKGGVFLLNRRKLKQLFFIFGVVLLILILFFGITRSGLSTLVSPTSNSAVGAFFVFGLLAGASSCAALVGGLVLSMSKQWSAQYGSNESFIQRSTPHLLFNAGRLISFVFLGGVLGAVGGALKISLTALSLLTIGISVMMVFLALQMLGFQAIQKFQPRLPKFITSRVANESNFKGKYMPIITGALTFLLPCGFTITAQGLALASGSVLTGSLIMFFFALGTLPMLVTIGFSSVTFTAKPHISNMFLKIAGFLVLFFGLYTFNAQLNVFGLPSLNDISRPRVAEGADISLPDLVDGKQLIRMEAYSGGYSPEIFTVRAGVPVRWEITDKGTSGCTNAVIAKGLFDGEINLSPGEVSVKEFIPDKEGIYKFSCWMGMVSGLIQVVGEVDNANTVTNDTTVVPSGAAGCGGDSGEGCTGGCGGGCGNPGCPYNNNL